LTSATVLGNSGPGGKTISFDCIGRKMALRGIGIGSGTTPGIDAPACECGIAPGVAPIDACQFPGTVGANVVCPGDGVP
jgi:hypothetical protein